MLHLIHPAFVHFSAALLVLGGVCEAYGIFSSRERARGFGSLLVLCGTISLIPTLASGFLAANTLDIPDAAQAILAAHERTGLSLLSVFLISQWWKAWYGGTLPGKQRFLYAAMLLVGVALAGYGAFLGGEMVYAEGVGVRAG